MKRCHGITIAVTILILIAPTDRSKAQAAPDDASSKILSLDRQFWQAYNTCDTVAFGRFLTEDLEFYHDKGGVTLGSDDLTASVKKNLCGDGSGLRREAVEGTVHVFPLSDKGVVYGAVLSGEHRFYVLEADRPERLDGQAKFVHLWMLKDGDWRMSRVLSYDHGPAAYVNARNSIAVEQSALDLFVGSYGAPQTGTLNIRRGEGALILATEGKAGAMTLYPESDSVFFVKERDLTFEFVQDDSDRVTGMRVRENGKVVEEAARVR